MHPKQLLDAATQLLSQVLTFQHPADAVLSHFFKDQRRTLNLGSRERGLLAQTTYNVLRHKLKYERLALSGSGPQARRLSILGYPTQSQSDLDFLLASLNAQERDWLQTCAQVSDSELLDQHRHNLPAWMVPPLKAQLGVEGFWQWVAANLQAAPLDLRVNTLSAKREPVLASLQAALDKPSKTITPTPYSPLGLRVSGHVDLNKLEIFKSGQIEVQDEGSQLLALLVDAKRGEMVADFCAGAGGKTLALGAAMRSTGRLYAFDTSAHRLAALKPRLARSGLSNIHPVAIAHERDERIKRLAGKMDRVLVDAPCSGLGTLRRNPDLKWRQKKAGVAELATLQTNILQSAARLVKSGGRLVYATCSVLPQENEEIAKAFSAANPDFVVMPVAQLLSDLKIEQSSDLCSGDYLRLWTHKHQTDGFFAAVWERK